MLRVNVRIQHVYIEGKKHASDLDVIPAKTFPACLVRLFMGLSWTKCWLKLPFCPWPELAAEKYYWTSRANGILCVQTFGYQSLLSLGRENVTANHEDLCKRFLFMLPGFGVSEAGSPGRCSGQPVISI